MPSPEPVRPTGETLRQTLAALPKIDLHRHLEGSLRLSTVVELARKSHLRVPTLATAQLRPLVQVTPQDAYTFRNFLSKFETLRTLYQSPEIIQRVAREVVLDAANDNVRYLELRFTPRALAKARDFPLADVTAWVIAATRAAAQETGIMLRLILSMNRNESVEIGAAVMRLAVEQKSNGVVGLDLAGDEVNYPAEPFVGLFREAHQSGLKITAHAGEWTSAPTVRHAIENLRAERIGHGVRVGEDPVVVALARERGVVFEVCPTSNYQSGVVSRLDRHPLPRMLADGLRVTLNTDDPGISDITLSDECRVAMPELKLSLADLKQMTLTAAAAAFLGPAERAALEADFRARLA